MGDDRDEGTYQGVAYQHWGVAGQVNLRQRRAPLRDMGEERALAVVDTTLLFAASRPGMPQNPVPSGPPGQNQGRGQHGRD